MKNSMKYVTISIVMIFAVLFLTMTRANASQIQLFTNNTTANNTVNNTANTTTNTATPVNSATEKEGIVKVNTINDATKDMPQTGETDVYIVAGIAVIAIAVGAFAFFKSRKYNI